MPSFDDILSAPTLFAKRSVLSPHYVPASLPFREREMERIMVAVAPALASERSRNLFVYGKTGTGKTCTVRRVMEEFSARQSAAQSSYINCRMYNSRYRVIQKLSKDFIPELDKSGFGLATLYEKLVEYVQNGKAGRHIIVVLDEVDMVRDLDELLYTLTRMNDEITAGSLSIIGITNRLSFKDALDPRSKSSLCETEMVFTPYTAHQLKAILERRAAEGFRPGVVDESALNLASAIAAQETGDARYALKLLLKAGELADEKKLARITDAEVEEARRNVDVDLATETIATLPIHQQLVLLAVCNLSIEGTRYQRLGGPGLPGGPHGAAGGAGEGSDHFLMSGEVYEEYSRVCRHYRKPKRSARWYREYLNDLEMLGLITTVESGRGMRGHTRLIKPGYVPEQMKKIIENGAGIHGPDDAPAGSQTMLGGKKEEGM
ncbi:MAG: AAA family ATPase [Candidatus Micrarchaeota archaeon]|nr:AAA family ATPase [Candidatus Micrarchaeota archaeon]